MESVAINMQEVLDSVQNWSDTNEMKLNAKKTKDMWICFGKSILTATQSAGVTPRIIWLKE
jgi:hypothetical protein